jgi:hypothetical protein
MDRQRTSQAPAISRPAHQLGGDSFQPVFFCLIAFPQSAFGLLAITQTS